MKIVLMPALMSSALFFCNVDAALFARGLQHAASKIKPTSILSRATPVRNFSQPPRDSRFKEFAQTAGDAGIGVAAGVCGLGASVAVGSVLGIEEVGMVGGLVVGPWAALVAGGPVGAGSFIATAFTWAACKKMNY